MVRRSLRIALFAFAVAAGARSATASSITIGVSDGGNCFPFNCNVSGVSSGVTTHWQQVYDASLFTGGSITAVTFFPYRGTSAIIGGDYTISLSNTARAVGGLSTNLATNVGGNQAVFFSGSIVGGPVTAPYTFSGTPFVFDPGFGNLLLDVVAINQPSVPNNGRNGYFDADYASTQMSRAFALADGTVGSNFGALVTQFDVTAAPVPEPASLLLLGTGLIGAGARRWRKRARA